MNTDVVIFFDGVCNLCNGAVQFVIKRDKQNYFKFAALQSDFAYKTLKKFTLQVKQGNSFVLLENGKVYEQSTAALKVARKLGGLWPILYIFIVIPPFLRNAIYRFIARNRYKWFGKQESCWVPTPALRSRFLD
ncbi:thiol-disulfide oxidoreductase DCC family protein [Pedobacter xixiisoli]|uniref:Predicted thiol-disulfide oxidoreductase YuxK, DCC family n=1 Tax=Pedobacter xixiisoli TaxID=1476464 RepID=A0A285ZND9_9SPHI|nr:DCC1-like thiol-disulfide oxidoreductase family protein [Pedobacter xixiisoli]SOD11171.1 Predicted thiol-disulfide oxidoreductase YuxK, DCC family [Pedobacter xixiisoli]